jgi:hypothetical protein
MAQAEVMKYAVICCRKEVYLAIPEVKGENRAMDHVKVCPNRP